MKTAAPRLKTPMRRINPQIAPSSRHACIVAAAMTPPHRRRLGADPLSSSPAVAPIPTPSSASSPPSPTLSPLTPSSSFPRAAVAALAAAALVAFPLAMPPSSMAVDNAKVGACVLSKCQSALAKCLGDGLCVKNLVCLQACNGAEDETTCQIKCGDRYEDKAIDMFNSCAVSEQKCVPQRADEGLFPIPPAAALDSNFDLSAFQGRWFITAGLNELFDTFPCQEHFFAAPKSGSKDTVYADINWRIPVGTNGDFLQRSTMQRFVQDPQNPAILYNHDNEYLHYEDDWYIIASKPDEYVFVYYRGQNDAWKGYGGATVYTRARSLPTELVPELKAAAEAAGLDWSKFIVTDNSCPAKPAPRGPLEELEEDFEVAERFAAARLGPSLESFGRGFTVMARQVEGEVEEVAKELADEEVLVAEALKKEAQEAQQLLRRLRMEAEMGGFGRWLGKNVPLSVREFIMPMPPMP